MARSAKKKEPADEVRHWLGEISSAKRREKDFRKDGEEVIAIYSGEKSDEIPFNILFSNTETLLPALFSQTPRPVVQRRFKDDDPVGRAASTAAQRMLEFLCDTNVDGYETFDQSMRAATLDGLLPGRGITCVKYDAEVLEGEGIDEPLVKWEQVCTESKQWNRVYFGFARKWSDVPWIAYEEYLDNKEAARLFGDEVADKIEYTAGEEEDEEEKGTGTGGKDDADGQGRRKTALVYQIWDKDGGRVVRYISPQYVDGYLLVQDDPLKLTGFYNCPRPIQFIEKTSDMTPTAVYKLYENQARELNNITRRIQKVVSAIKVRGVYDGSLGSELESILKEDDNALLPTDKTASLAAEGGIEKAIWFMPIEKLIVVLQQLIVAREQAKRVIYEITGVSDIIRGQSVASETLGAQKIKEAWGTMRLKRLQKAVQIYCRDTLRLMLEIAASKMSEQSWAKATGLPFVTGDQKAQAQMIMQAAQAQGMQPDPQTMQALQSPAWPDILNVLRDDMQRAYKIDIETNSTIDVEATEDQKNIGDFMNAMGQLMAGLNPMVEKGSMPFEAAKAMMLAVVRRFRFGTEVEDELKMMTAPKGNPEAAKAQQEAQTRQAEMQQEMSALKQDAQVRQAEMQQDMQFKMLELKADMQLEAQRMMTDKQSEVAKLQAQITADAGKVESQRQIEQMKATIQRDTELKKAALNAAAQIEIARINATAQAQSAAEEAGGEEDEKPDAMMSGILEMQAKLLAQLAQPKAFKGKTSTGRVIELVQTA